MGASLAWGITHTSQARGWVVALADMPFIRPATVQSVAKAVQQGALLAAPIYQGRRGHPVGFAKALGKELASLSSDVGAQGVIRAYQNRLISIATDDSGILRDIDRPANLNGPNGDAIGTEFD
jgi:molybdenum cofactor cytidylyltransferase